MGSPPLAAVCNMSQHHLDNVHYTIPKPSLDGSPWMSFFCFQNHAYSFNPIFPPPKAPYSLRASTIHYNEWLCWSSVQNQGLLFNQYCWLIAKKVVFYTARLCLLRKSSLSSIHISTHPPSRSPVMYEDIWDGGCGGVSYPSNFTTGLCFTTQLLLFHRIKTVKKKL